MKLKAGRIGAMNATGATSELGRFMGYSAIIQPEKLSPQAESFIASRYLKLRCNKSPRDAMRIAKREWRESQKAEA